MHTERCTQHTQIIIIITITITISLKKTITITMKNQRSPSLEHNHQKEEDVFFLGDAIIIIHLLKIPRIELELNVIGNKYTNFLKVMCIILL